MKIKFQENIPLAKFSSYKIGGPARYFFEAHNIEEIKKALQEAKDKNLRIFILGGGTNLLISDRGFDGLVLKPNINFLENKGNKIKIGAGVSVAALLDFTIKKSLSGLEWAGGLPGTVGGAIRGNAGCFGGEMKDSVESVRSINIKTLKEKERSFKECGFGYRSSIFKKNNGEEIILSATLLLKKGAAPKIKAEIQKNIEYRKANHPMEYPSIGSIFKNVVAEEALRVSPASLREAVKEDPYPVVPAAYFISKAGLKGISLGGAMVSVKHPNFIVNVLNATAADVRGLIRLVKERVKKKFEVELEEEIIEV
jgi:UDP-N-acetylmuramate dehydrogenase